jgi:hypothetical protein
MINSNIANCQTDTTIYESIDSQDFAPYMLSDSCNNIVDYNSRKRCCDSSLLADIRSKIIYPNQAFELGIEGTVVISFIVKNDSTISQISIRKKIGGGCEEEAIRVLYDIFSKKKWIPASKNNKNINLRYNLPIKFAIKKYDPLTKKYNYKEEKVVKDNSINNQVIPKHNSGTICVKGYYKKDGTYVKPHTKKRNK